MSKRGKGMVPISSIRVDSIPLCPLTLEYANSILNGAKFPAIKIATHKDGYFILKDGRHRLAAHKLAGKHYILASYSTRPLQK